MIEGSLDNFSFYSIIKDTFYFLSTEIIKFKELETTNNLKIAQKLLLLAKRNIIVRNYMNFKHIKSLLY